MTGCGAAGGGHRLAGADRHLFSVPMRAHGSMARTRVLAEDIEPL